MADFNVAIRSSYRDVARLALDLSPGDWVLAPDGRVVKWRNSAPPQWSGSYRMGDAERVVHERRPRTSGDAVLFSALEQTGLVVPGLTASALSQDWTFAWEFYPGERTAKQVLIWSTYTVDFWVLRIDDDATNHSFRTNGGTIVSADGEMDGGTYLMAFDGAGAAVVYRDGVAVNSGAVANVQLRNTTAGDEPGGSLLIGYNTTGAYLDGRLRSLRAWHRVLSAKERDLVWKTLGTLDSSSGVAPDERADVQVRSWVDGTGDLSLRQARRVNPPGGRHQSFRCAVTDESAGIVQIACETDGDVLADADLGGDLYSIDCVERASPADPTVTQDAGWSSVFDVRIPASGHYTFRLSRENHGAVYVHLDAEVG